MAKVTKVEMRNRVQDIQGLLLSGRSRAAIHRHCEIKWGIADRQADEYIKLATDEIDEALSNSAERNLAIITGNLWELFRQHGKTDLGGKRTILLDIAKLQGLDRIDINLKIDRPLKDLSDDQLSEELAKEEG